ncbi:hypothetical protein IAU60_000463 [Kwoniella sp. DSM 27419]
MSFTLRSLIRLRACSPWRPLYSLNVHTSAVVRQSEEPSKPATTKPIKSRIARSSLPSAKVDAEGRPVTALDPWDEVDGRVKPRPSPGTLESVAQKPDPEGQAELSSDLSTADEEAQIAQAIADGTIPDSALSREVYANWLRFPDCILLTRVGKFYESYFEPARQLSAVLNIKLASKKYKATDGRDNREFPFAGFPVAGLDKYLKILVQDLGHTVVLVEEYDEEGSVAFVGKKITASSAPKERRVYRVVTPGTMVDEGWLNGDESRYLLALAMREPAEGPDPAEGNPTNAFGISMAYTDPTTGEFFTKETTIAQMEDELARIAPREVVLDRNLQSAWSTLAEGGKDEAPGLGDLFSLLQVLGVHVSFADSLRPPPLWGARTVSENPIVKPATPEGEAIALLRHHLLYALRESTPTLTQPSRQSDIEQMQIDAATLQALEIRHALRPGGLVAIGGERPYASPLSARGTLLSVISKTVTPSGHRLLIRTLTAPSTSLPLIDSRLELVQALVDRHDLRAELRDTLRDVGDVMRIIQRFKSQRGDGRDIWEVRVWIRAVQGVLSRIREDIQYERSRSTSCAQEWQTRLQTLIDGFVPLSDLLDVIERSIDETAIMHGIGSEGDEADDNDGMIAAADAMVAEPEPSQTKVKEMKESKKEREEREKQAREDRQWWIYPSFSTELEGLHNALDALKSQKEKMQSDLIKRFGTPSLKLYKSVRYGYHVQMDKLDASSVIKARSLESIGSTGGKTAYFAFGPWSALGARTEITTENLSNAQRRASRELRNIVVERSEEIRKNAELVDEMDLALSFAQNAVEMGWVRPQLDDSTDLDIVAGRHPSIESSLLLSSRNFTPNSTKMDSSSHLHIITGPNQGGKSTLLRQTAVIAILAQSGSFVPASSARIGIIDKVFSRVGARDDLWRDRSTFMLEMVETAAILKHATNRSLVIMDEIGRGTTLQAGISIAYATLNHILRHIKCRTLFATHYHELGRMLGHGSSELGVATQAQSSPRQGVSFWCTDIDEIDGAFSYSYRLRPGINHQSHAIKAARLAGMPDSFLAVAELTLRAVQATGRFDPPSDGP